MARGIQERHSRGCRSRQGGRCNCDPTYRVRVWDPRQSKRYSRGFMSLDAAQDWQREAMTAIRYGGAPRLEAKDSLEAVASAWLDDAERGIVRNKSGQPFKPSALRSYETALRLRVLPAFGQRRLADIRRADLQRFIYRLQRDGLDAGTIMVTLLPLRAIYRQAIADDTVRENPTRDLQLPAVTGRRDRVASLSEAAELIAALPEGERALWATAFYGGLRRGELQALRWDAVDLARGVLRVERGWDQGARIVIETKDRKPRTVPITAVLRDYLLDHKLAAGGEDAAGYVFGTTPDRPFEPTVVMRRARSAWKTAKLDRITLHECRHSYASLMIDAGVNAKALSTFMGHANISITLDRYGHLMPGSENQAAALFDAYVEREAEKARAASAEGQAVLVDTRP